MQMTYKQLPTINLTLTPRHRSHLSFSACLGTALSLKSQARMCLLAHH